MDNNYKIKIIIISFTNKCDHLSTESNDKSSMIINYNTEFVFDLDLYCNKLKEFENNLIEISTIKEFYNNNCNNNNTENIIQFNKFINKKNIIKYIEQRFNLKINTTHITDYKLIIDCCKGIIYCLNNNNNIFIKCNSCNQLNGKIINNINKKDCKDYIYEISLFKEKSIIQEIKNKPIFNIITHSEKFNFNKIKKNNKLKKFKNNKNNLDKHYTTNITIKQLLKNIIEVNNSLQNIIYNNNNNEDNIFILNNDDYIKNYLKLLIKIYKKNKIKNIEYNKCVLIIDFEKDICSIIIY